MPTPDKLELIEAAIRDASDAWHVSIPAKVKAYDVATQTVTAIPQILIPYQDEELDSGVGYRECPPISGVPVLFPRGNGGYILWRLAVGDPVMLVFASASLDDWKQLGGVATSPVKPESDRRFNISDAWAIPGVSPPTAPIAGAAGHADLCIEAATEIKLGAGATKPATFGSNNDANWAALNTWFTANAVALAAAGLTAGPVWPTTGIPPGGSPDLTSASKVKVE